MFLHFGRIKIGTGAAPTTYDYGYGRAAQTYDTSKTYYQQAGATAGYTPQTYDTAASAAAKVFLK